MIMEYRPPTPSDIETGANKARLPPPPYTRHRPTPPAPPPPIPEPWVPWLVPVIIMANMTMFAYTMYVNNCPASETQGEHCVFSSYLGRFSFQPFKENPLLGPSSTTLMQVGGLERNAVVKEGEGWRLVSCMWLHAGLIHLVANMLSLVFIGIRLEKEFGFLRIGLLYLLSGFGGSVLSALSLKSVSVGASGALFGLLGAMLSELFTNWTIYSNKCAALLTLILIIALNLGLGFLPRVDNSAHIGGFLSGFFLGFILLVHPQYGYVSPKHIPPGYNIKRKPRHKLYQYLLGITAFVILIIGYAVGLGMLYSGHKVKPF